MGLYEEHKVWDKHWDKSSDNLLKQYKQAFNRILTLLYDLTGEEFTSLSKKQQQELLLQVSAIITELNKDNEEWIEKEVSKAFLVGQASTLVSLGIAASIKEGMGKVSQNNFIKNTVDIMLMDTYDDLLYATDYTDKRTKKLVREVFSSSFRQGIIEKRGLKGIEKEAKGILTKKFLEEKVRNEAFLGIVDSSQRKWKLDTYVEMVTRTKFQDAFRTGSTTEAVERGVDLGFVSSHNTDCPKCRKFEGLVISLTGKTAGYPSLDSIKASKKIELFHPRCKHKINPVRSYELIPENVKRKNEEARKYI